MSDRQALVWVQRNRARVTRTRAAGKLLERLAGQVRYGEMAPSKDAALVIAGFVDADFRRHCKVAGVRRGRLVINVDEVPLVYPTRLRWELVLRRALSEKRMTRAVSGVVFEYGKDGVLIGKSPGRNGGADKNGPARTASDGRRE